MKHAELEAKLSICWVKVQQDKLHDGMNFAGTKVLLMHAFCCFWCWVNIPNTCKYAAVEPRGCWGAPAPLSLYNPWSPPPHPQSSLYKFQPIKRRKMGKKKKKGEGRKKKKKMNLP